MQMFQFPWEMVPIPIPHFIIAVSVLQILFFILQKIELCPALLDLCVANSRKVQEGELWRLVLHVFLHGSFYHLFHNLLAQALIGWYIESQMGTWITVCLYFTSAAGGDLLSAAIKSLQNKVAVGVGASGAVFGLEAIYILQLCNIIHLNPNSNEKDKWYLLVFFGFTILSSFGFGSDSVDVWAHIGGFVTGALMAATINIYECIPEYTISTELWLYANIGYHGLLLLIVFLVTHPCFSQKPSKLARIRKEDVQALVDLGIPVSVAKTLLKENNGNVHLATQAYFQLEEAFPYNP